MEKMIRVLLADTSEDFRSLFRDMIAHQEDIELIGSVDDGEEALALAMSALPDVLVTDVLLRRRDGLSLMRSLKENRCLPPTIVVSAFMNDSVVAQVNRLGAEYCVTKPCRLPELLEHIRRCAGGESLTRRSVSGAYETDIVEVLVNFGVMHHLNGYRFLQEGIRRTLQDPEALRGVTKILYPELARSFGTTAVRVERSMRSALEAAWENGDASARKAYFGASLCPYERRPTNSEFLAMSAEFIRLKQKKAGSW